MNKIIEDLSKLNPNAIIYDGLDDALITIVENEEGKLVALYNSNKIIKLLTSDMSEEEAVDYFYYNISGAYLGENTPMLTELKMWLLEKKMKFYQLLIGRIFFIYVFIYKI